MRIFRLSILLLMIAPALLAQDFAKFEVYGGFSRMREKSNIDTFSYTDPSGATTPIPDLCSAQTGEMLGPNSQQFFCKRRNFDGFDLSLTWNLTRYLGVTGNVTRHTKDQTFVDDFGGITQTIRVRERLTYFLAGVRLKDNGSNARFKPFAHALIGTARYTDRQSQDIDAFPEANYVAEDRETSLAMKIGGGLDIRVTPHVDIRAIEVDYTPVYAGDRHYDSISGPFAFDVTGKTAQNYTIGFGVVVH